jgi:hypothetical protein
VKRQVVVALLGADGEPDGSADGDCDDGVSAGDGDSLGGVEVVPLGCSDG